MILALDINFYYKVQRRKERMSTDVKTPSSTGTVELNTTTVSTPRYNGTNPVCSAISNSSEIPTTTPNNDDGFNHWVTVLGRRGGKKTSHG
jgi:hypothetical protein